MGRSSAKAGGVGVGGGGGRRAASHHREDLDESAPGWIGIWRLWRHCLCRFGWYPLFVAPLVTCACLLDVYSSTGCDFVRMDVGFAPANDVFFGSGGPRSSSRAQLGLFSFDSREDDADRYKRWFNNGCRSYSAGFESAFVSSDRTWHVARVMAYVSGISSLVALSTAWLLTITPLPASFFWPGVLLPAVVLAMVTGAGKFIFFQSRICSEALWYVDERSEPVPAQSCEIGESSVFGIASSAAYFFCTLLICFRSPRKRVLDEGFGKRSSGGRTPQGSCTITHSHLSADGGCDPEQGTRGEDTAGGGGGSKDGAGAGAGAGSASGVLGAEKRVDSLHDSGQTERAGNKQHQQRQRRIDGKPQIIEHGPQHNRTTSDVTWSTDSKPAFHHERSRNLGVLSPPEDARAAPALVDGSAKKAQKKEGKQPQAVLVEEDDDDAAGDDDVVEWNAYGRPIVVTINDSRSLSYSDEGSSSKQTGGGSSGRSTVPSGNGGSGGVGNSKLPPRHNGKSTIQGNNAPPRHNRNNSGDWSVHSRISRISFADSQASDDMSALGMHSYSVGLQVGRTAGAGAAGGAPSVVAIPTRRASSAGNGSSAPSPHRNTFSGQPPSVPSPSYSYSAGHHSPSQQRLRYAKGRRARGGAAAASGGGNGPESPAREEDRDDAPAASSSACFLGEQHRIDARREIVEYMPRLDEMSATRSLGAEDHGDLINQCVRDLEASFNDQESGFRTM